MKILLKKLYNDIIYIKRDNIPIIEIQKIVSEFFRISLSDILSKQRLSDIVKARDMAMYITREITTISLPEIGKHFGKRHHTTVLHSCKKMEKNIDNNAKTKQDYETLKIKITTIN